MVADEHRDALAELYRRHAGWLVARLRHRCADDGLVAEAVQDTFVAVWRGASGYSGTGAVAGWMWAIAIRRLIGILRKRRPEPVPADPHLADSLAGVEDRVLSGTEHGDLAGALRSLSPELRAVVQATVLDGLTTREAGRYLGIPAGTVKTRHDACARGVERSPGVSWHVDETSAAHYAARGLDASNVASVESHLLACDRCRATVSAQVDHTLLDAIWSSVTDQLDQPAVSRFEQVLRWTGCSDATARIVAATTRARWSYLIAVGFSLFLAVSAAQSSGEQSFGLYLVVAPLGPLVATAGAFGRWSDPAYALVMTSPTSSLRILLVRLVTSVLPAIALTALSVPWVIDRGWLAIAWLLPSLALATGALALSSWIDIERAAIGLGLAWLVPPMLLRLQLHRLLELLGTPAQLISVLVLVTAVGIVTTRRNTFDHWEA